MLFSNTISLSALIATVSAYDLPSNLKSIYDTHKSTTCKHKISRTYDGGAAFCGDIPGVIYLKGKAGNYDNMDIDCDGANNSGGACSNDPSGQSQTSFKSTVKHYGIKDLDAHIHPYVVFGNDGFDPEDHGVKPLSVVAVVCNNQVFYGIWGDTNGATHTGEASLAMGQLCFPNEDISGDSGHDAKDVLYLGFMGDHAVPGKDAAKWTAKTKDEFEASIKSLGDQLVAGLTA